MDRVKGKAAIVTGAGAGIGEATAKLLAAEGAAVAVTDINDGGGQATVEAIQAAGGRAIFRHMDISREAEVEKAFSEIYAEFGQLHILVNNAGIVGKNDPPEKQELAEWDAVLAVNLRGPFLCIKHAVPYIRKTGQGGSIVNVSSIMAMLGGPSHVYNASKGGVRSMTKADAWVYAKEGIRVNSIHPGFINTPLFRNFAEKEPKGLDAAIQRHNERIPLGRMGAPEDLAQGILYLASDESSYVTGIELVVDGGCMLL